MHDQQIADSGTWSLGVLIGGPVTVLLALIGLAAIGVGIWLKAKGERDTWILTGGGSAWLAVVVGLAVSPLGFWPFAAEYHQWREVSGTVQQIDKRLIGSGDKMEDKFVVRFTDGGLQFGCDDTRCASVREGDSLTLSCKRAWQYTGTDGYDCRFVSTEAK